MHDIISKNKDFQTLARSKGILSPEVTYERRQKAYSIRILIPNPRGDSYIYPAVGVYTSLAEAEERLEADIQAFLLRYPDALDTVTKRYHNVTETASEETQDTRREIAQHLLTALQNPHHAYYLDSQIATLAQATMNYIRDLEAAQPPAAAKGTYSSRLPDQPKSAITWEQPVARQHPVYRFDLTCPYCADKVILERHSPREPQHCDKETCATEHRRVLARDRKRRQRQRKSKSR